MYRFALAGLQSESYFPIGFNPFVEFGSFASSGLIHSTLTRLFVPVSFTGRVNNLNAQSLEIVGDVILGPDASMGSGEVTIAELMNSGTLSPGEQKPGHLTIDGHYKSAALFQARIPRAVRLKYVGRSLTICRQKITPPVTPPFTPPRTTRPDV